MQFKFFNTCNNKNNYLTLGYRFILPCYNNIIQDHINMQIICSKQKLKLTEKIFIVAQFLD